MAIISRRYAVGTELLACAVAGDRDSVGRLLRQLGSVDARVRQPIMDAIGTCIDLRLWQRLLTCLALHRWDEDEGCQPCPDGAASQRIDGAITDLFVENDLPEVVPVKLAALRAGLSDTNRLVRGVAAALLGLRGDPQGFEVLADAVRSGDPECQLQAIAALRAWRDERAAWVLIEALASNHEKVHHEADRALSELGDHAIPALTDALKHPQPHVRWHAVRALAEIGGVKSPNALVEALADADFSVRWAAAEALAAIGEPAVLAILERLARPTIAEDMRYAVYHALHQIPSRRIQARLRPLLAALRGPTAAFESPQVARQLLRTWTDPAKQPGRSRQTRLPRKNEVSHE